MDATAVAATALGLSGIGIGLAASTASLHEEVEIADFDLNGERIQACLWKNPFKEGDEVEIVAEQWLNKWKAFGVARPADRLIALYPHCSRGRRAHYKFAARMWLLIGGACLLATILLALAVDLFSRNPDPVGMILFLLGWPSLLCMGVAGVVAYRVASKYMPFIRIAEGVFGTLGWKDPKSINLPAISRQKTRPSDPCEMNYLFFRY